MYSFRTLRKGKAEGRFIRPFAKSCIIYHFSEIVKQKGWKYSTIGKDTHAVLCLMLVDFGKQ
ncbi:hypothetical protein D1B31_04050 [Neobacillus notoginsengisoli]|uniref:Uncharacterized protein n=1 Tax=Neobacillus notoginsengisoli TaxID=1578198 RepID=A0A417YYF3_9BACI|nr:hypothetical protein D1B31_04050 [Neobacillus notoginsengisoli]